MDYCETGRIPLAVNRQFNMLKYWVKLLKTDNCILKHLYLNMFHANSKYNVPNWLSEIRSVLISIGMNEFGKHRLLRMKNCFYSSPNKA